MFPWLQAVDREYKTVSRSFTDVAAAFLDSANQAAPSHSSPDRHSRQYPLTDRQDPPHSVEPRAGRVGIYCHLDQMQRELSRPFKVQAASLKRIQLHFGQSVSEWYSALPRAAKSGHGQLKELVRPPVASLPHVCIYQPSIPATSCSKICVAQRMHCSLRQCFILKCSHAGSHVSKLLL